MHHPPFATGIAHMDRYGLRDAAAFAEIVSLNQQIERILCGHLHRAIDRRFAGTAAGTAAIRFRAAGLPAPSLARGYRARQSHRDFRRLAWPLSVSRRRLSYRR